MHSTFMLWSISGQKHLSCGLFQACDMCAILISQTLQLHIHVMYISVLIDYMKHH